MANNDTIKRRIARPAAPDLEGRGSHPRLREKLQGSILRGVIMASLVAAIILLASPVRPAEAATPPDLVRLVSAKVLARGAAARLILDVRCGGFADLSSVRSPGYGVDEHEPQPYATLSVILSQPRTGARKVEMFTRDCFNGEVSVLVLPEPGAPAFRRGMASVRAVLNVCQPYSPCGTFTHDFTTRLRRGQAMPPLTTPGSPKIVSTALVSKGAALRVVMEGSCSGHDHCGARALISQRVRKTTTQSSADIQIAASGDPAGPFRIALLLPVQPKQHKFRPGKRAYIQVGVDNCNVVYGCSSETVEVITKLTKNRT